MVIVGSAVTNFLWDEASAYGDVVYEYNGTGGALASYVLGGTGLISQTRGTTTNYFLQDGQGSTRGLVSTTGTVTDSYSYTAFGKLFSSIGTTTNSYRYTGQQLDTSTGLYSLRARYYNPALGRFLSGDTYPVNLGNPVELNRYVYTANRPINLSDPSGKVAMIDFAIRSIAIGGATGAVYGIGQTLACGGNLFINMWLGAQIGAGFGALLAYNPGLALGGGVLLAAHGELTAIQDIEVHGGNGCNVFKAVTSMLMLAFSANGLAAGAYKSNTGIPEESLSDSPKPISSKEALRLNYERGLQLILEGKLHQFLEFFRTGSSDATVPENVPVDGIKSILGDIYGNLYVVGKPFPGKDLDIILVQNKPYLLSESQSASLNSLAQNAGFEDAHLQIMTPEQAAAFRFATSPTTPMHAFPNTRNPMIWRLIP